MFSKAQNEVILRKNVMLWRSKLLFQGGVGRESDLFSKIVQFKFWGPSTELETNMLCDFIIVGAHIKCEVNRFTILRISSYWDPPPTGNNRLRSITKLTLGKVHKDIN